ncbi:sigma-54 dependent transcriptional regulator [Tropicimonas sp. TH_r6]|uniref:sigma-54-dependent transcriptional regulator n=1 Tax=Tropicimonas sp. TH_r6 TaxID=3082085 RepID=UPI00295486E7|nr:sigma-54 dependent transcriptional regulator [Tropicimonas sp. TH_r6]MDV7142402.1 sigma-54 dependent transcriptional regulator [Tropicimonas sp. TH_r6]
MTRILLVEDIPALRLVYEAALREDGHEVTAVGTAAEGLAAFRELRPEVLLLDLMLPDRGGLELMEDCLDLMPTANVIVITANRSVPVAVEAMRAGAYDFLIKPFEPRQLQDTVRNAAAGSTAEPDPAETGPLERFCGFIGGSSVMQKVYGRVQSAARSMATVFVTGENGTGKDLCARAVHSCSPRANGPFQRFSCSAVPAERQESELFGHLRGAFVGALSDKVGAVEAADGGTLFLDDISALAPAMQPALLRLLQSGKIQPVGAAEPLEVNVRIVCADSNPPVEVLGAGRLRKDLYYQLHVIPIHLPPLRDRACDVIEIARHTLDRHARVEGKQLTALSNAVRQEFLRHDWPGNVREVISVMHNIAVLHDGSEVTPEMLPPEYGFGAPRWPRSNGGEAQAEEAFEGMTLAEIERQVIEACILRHGGSVPQAARELDVAPSTLYRKRAGWNGAAER